MIIHAFGRVHPSPHLLRGYCGGVRAGIFFLTFLPHLPSVAGAYFGLGVSYMLGNKDRQGVCCLIARAFFMISHDFCIDVLVFRFMFFLLFFFCL